MFDEEIEKAVLYAIIFEKKDYDIKEIDFINVRNIKIAKAIIELKKEKQSISMIAISNKINANKKQIIEYLSHLGDNVFGFNPDESYKELVKLSQKRELLSLSQELMSNIRECEDINICFEQTANRLKEIQNREETEESFTEQIANTMQEIEETYKNRDDKSLYTGVIPLDNKMYGLHKEELTIIGARPGVGKTTFALQIAEHIASKGKNIMFISLEMSSTQLIKKMISKKGNVNSYKLRIGTLEDKDFEDIVKATTELYQNPITINTKVRYIQQIESLCRRKKNQGKLDVIIIDYIQLLRSDIRFNNREQEVADISRRLKLLSLELEVPIIALCQLNRNASKNEPTLADLRESGSLEQDADNILFLYYENEEEEDAKKISVKLAKQRAGEQGKFKLLFDKRTGTFREA